MDPSPRTTEPVWEDQHQLLADLAVGDLRDGLDIRPTMVAFDAAGSLFLATVRPFDKGRHHDAIIEVGALADILVIDGNPLADITVLGATDRWFTDPANPAPVESIAVIMKDGTIIKNMLV